MESDNETPPPRPSKFKEATMNSVASIHPPPDELWKDLGMDKLMDKFNEENKAPPKVKKGVPVPAPPANEGPFGRFSRVFTSLFGGSGGGLSALGKRKAGNQTAEKDDRRKQAELAYQEAKELGLLPKPQVFVRPTAKPHKPVTTPTDTPTPPVFQARTPTLYKSSSKRDLQKQKKLTKRVSDLEYKLAAARKELSLALSPEHTPPVPPIPSTLPSTPTPIPAPPKNESVPSPQNIDGSTSSANKLGKITKKRKVTSDDQAYKPVTTDSDFSVEEGERSVKRSKTIKKPKRQSSRLSKNKGHKHTEEVVIVVPDGVTVPPMPSIPKEVNGKRAVVRDDGYGGLGHEMF